MNSPVPHVRTTPLSRDRRWLVRGGIAAAIGAIFFVDLQLPNGVAAGVPYVGAVLFSLYLESRRATVYTALVCSVLVLLAALLVEPTQTTDEDLVANLAALNRGYALLAIWVTALAVSTRVVTEEQLRILASRDALTGAHNRRQLLELLQHAFTTARRYRQPLSVCVADLDGFKAVNDSFGHAAGDAVLVAFTKLLTEALRDADVVGRIGGDEFCVILPQTTSADAVGALERVRDRAAAMEWVPGEKLTKPVTVTFGVATLGPGVESPDELIRAADAALYRGKDAGRNRIVAAV